MEKVNLKNLKAAAVTLAGDPVTVLEEAKRKNANFIAAANPETIKTLIECIEKMSEALNEYREICVLVPPDGGHWHPAATALDFVNERVEL